MATTGRSVNLSAEMAEALPFLRRYARALTGSQATGDKYAVAALEAVVANPESIGFDFPAKIGLFRVFHKIWDSTGGALGEGEDGADAPLTEERAHWRLSGLSDASREALLLHAIEELEFDQVGAVLEITADEASALYDKAMSDMSAMVTGDVLIIEDEAIIAMDLQAIVSSMGHRVTGVARTYDGAVRLGEKDAPDLILADIQLADRSSGIDAVKTLLAQLGERPVIFITAFPERLLTGKRPEPAFLITKPYSEEQVRAAVSQAMFFATTRDMKGGM